MVCSASIFETGEPGRTATIARLKLASMPPQAKRTQLGLRLATLAKSTSVTRCFHAPTLKPTTQLLRSGEAPTQK